MESLRKLLAALLVVSISCLMTGCMKKELHEYERLAYDKFQQKDFKGSMDVANEGLNHYKDSEVLYMYASVAGGLYKYKTVCNERILNCPLEDEKYKFREAQRLANRYNNEEVQRDLAKYALIYGIAVMREKTNKPPLTEADLRDIESQLETLQRLSNLTEVIDFLR